MELTDEWREHLSTFMENLRLAERKQCEGIRSIQSGINKWLKFMETIRYNMYHMSLFCYVCSNLILRIFDLYRNPDAILNKISEEKLFSELKQWSKVCIS